MPLVRIDVQAGRTPAQLRRIADTVQEVMLDVFAAPPGDRYQIITEHPVGHIIAEDTGLGLERTDGVTVIQIFQQGRNAEQKQAAYDQLAKRLDAAALRPAGGSDRLGDGQRARGLVLRTGPGPVPHRRTLSHDPRSMPVDSLRTRHRNDHLSGQSIDSRVAQPIRF